MLVWLIVETWRQGHAGELILSETTIFRAIGESGKRQGLGRFGRRAVRPGEIGLCRFSQVRLKRGCRRFAACEEVDAPP